MAVQNTKSNVFDGVIEIELHEFMSAIQKNLSTSEDRRSNKSDSKNIVGTVIQLVKSYDSISPYLGSELRNLELLLAKSADITESLDIVVNNILENVRGHALELILSENKVAELKNKISSFFENKLNTKNVGMLALFRSAEIGFDPAKNGHLVFTIHQATKDQSEIIKASFASAIGVSVMESMEDSLSGYNLQLDKNTQRAISFSIPVTKNSLIAAKDFSEILSGISFKEVGKEAKEEEKEAEEREEKKVEEKEAEEREEKKVEEENISKPRLISNSAEQPQNNKLKEDIKNANSDYDSGLFGAIKKFLNIKRSDKDKKEAVQNVIIDALVNETPLASVIDAALANEISLTNFKNAAVQAPNIKYSDLMKAIFEYPLGTEAQRYKLVSTIASHFSNSEEGEVRQCIKLMFDFGSRFGSTISGIKKSCGAKNDLVAKIIDEEVKERFFEAMLKLNTQQKSLALDDRDKEGLKVKEEINDFLREINDDSIVGLVEKFQAFATKKNEVLRESLLANLKEAVATKIFFQKLQSLQNTENEAVKGLIKDAAENGVAYSDLLCSLSDESKKGVAGNGVVHFDLYPLSDDFKNSQVGRAAQAEVERLNDLVVSLVKFPKRVEQYNAEFLLELYKSSLNSLNLCEKEGISYEILRNNIATLPDRSEAFGENRGSIPLIIKSVNDVISIHESVSKGNSRDQGDQEILEIINRITETTGEGVILSGTSATQIGQKSSDLFPQN